MKRISLLAIVFMAGFYLQAQVVVGFQLPPAGLHLKSQLWNLSLINTGSDEPNVKIELLMTDASNNQQVLSGSSRVFRMKKGAALITASDAGPIVYNVLNPAYGIDANPVGYLPVGHFNFCMQVIRMDVEVSERLAEECETVQIEPVSPPMLMIPHDEERVESTRPLFTWIPPAPQNLFSNLQYDLVLVEVMSTQNSSSAIQQNIPLYTKQNVGLTTDVYPLSYPELDTAKLYAWQVTAKNNSSPVASSEIWTFKVRKFGTDTGTVVRAEYFAKLRRESDASYVICAGALRFEYLNELNDTTLQLKLTDLSSTSRSVVTLDHLQPSIKLGQNFISIDLSDEPIINKHIYQLEVINGKNERSYLKLEYRQPTNQ